MSRGSSRIRNRRGAGSNGEYEVLFNLSPYQIAVLIFNIKYGSKHKMVGFEDADYTEHQLRLQLDNDTKIPVTKSALESALWSCNLLSEVDEFQHPEGKEFKQFVGELLMSRRQREWFDFEYNLIRKKESQNES